MVWLRKSLVHFLAFVLLIALLGGVLSLGINRNFGDPGKIKAWLAESKIYDKAVSAVLDNSQDESAKNGTSTPVSLKDPIVQQAGKQAFSPELLQNSVNTFIDANYAWLSGKTATPEFNIDLTAAKQDFATRVGKYVETRLAALPACTAQQQTQLQIPVDTLSITCRPVNLDPKTEGTRVTQEINNGDFLGKPLITADSLGRDNKNQQNKPYYVQASKAPQIYRLSQKAPLILALVALISALLIVVIAPVRRKGWRRVGVVVLIAGILLIASKFITSAIIYRLEHKPISDTVTNQLRQPRNDLLNHIESQFAQINLWFGVAFVVLAIVIFVALYKTRDGKPQKSKIIEVPTPKPEKKPADELPVQPLSADDIRLAPRPKPTSPPGLGPNSKKPKPPRLIQ